MMANSREKILKRIRQHISRENNEKQLQEKLQKNARGILPSRAKNLSHDQLVALFIEQAENALVKIECITHLSLIPSRVMEIIKQQQFPLSLRVSANLTLNWENYPELVVNVGAANVEDKLCLTDSLCGVAETGTLVLVSSAEHPTTLNFLPEIHLVFLNKNNIVPFYEDAWDLIREKKINSRTINFITGASRTGDIEQTVQIGIHGPKKLYIFLYEVTYDNKNY